MAYDSCRTTTDSLKQLQYVEKRNNSKGTPGLKSMMKARSHTAEEYVGATRRHPRF
ncbi:hypothetical protein [Hymenobacter glacialis]|uniref:hypothetical protein n=1 Tax=Hymenobacter glacialis TaxID=1908236 RepID=UPI0013015776|nr:hypothetical protein [Hymenobacter glacialis]